ncbi:MAG: tryptophan-rich sensory protein [Bacteroidaceae bacterium]|nr:tryptophan-rich sensory protein [Bacteroidaceae bacterium]
MKKSLSVAIWVVLCLVLGYLSSLLQSESIVEWYPTLVRSPLSPPNWLFPVAWTLLYILMGISVGLLAGVRTLYATVLYVLFVIQLALNIMWSFFFFYLQDPLIGFMDIILLDMFALLYIVGAFVVNKPSAWLFLPYVIWLMFATYLNGYIMIYN